MKCRSSKIRIQYEVYVYLPFVKQPFILYYQECQLLKTEEFLSQNGLLGKVNTTRR